MVHNILPLVWISWMYYKIWDRVWWGLQNVWIQRGARTWSSDGLREVRNVRNHNRGLWWFFGGGSVLSSGCRLVKCSWFRLITQAGKLLYYFSILFASPIHVFAFLLLYATGMFSFIALFLKVLIHSKRSCFLVLLVIVVIALLLFIYVSMQIIILVGEHWNYGGIISFFISFFNWWSYSTTRN